MAGNVRSRGPIPALVIAEKVASYSCSRPHPSRDVRPRGKIGFQAKAGAALLHPSLGVSWPAFWRRGQATGSSGVEGEEGVYSPLRDGCAAFGLDQGSLFRRGQCHSWLHDLSERATPLASVQGPSLREGAPRVTKASQSLREKPNPPASHNGGGGRPGEGRTGFIESPVTEGRRKWLTRRWRTTACRYSTLDLPAEPRQIPERTHAIQRPKGGELL
jgi:hypothetical protein